MEETVVKAKGINSGLSIKPNGIVEIKVEFDNSQLAKILGILQLAGKDFNVAAKLDNEKKKLGSFGFYSMNIDRDGDAKISLRSTIEDVAIENIERLYNEQETVLFAFVSAEEA